MASVRQDRLDGVQSSVALKAPVVVATTANITLSGTQTIDGVAVVADDRVLVKNQTATAENGIYDVSATAWTRARDWNGARDIVSGTRVFINSGTVNAGFQAQITTANPITIGTTGLAFTLVDLIDATVAADLATIAPISADITTVAGISGNVTTVAGISADVTTVAGISANVTTVAGDTANIATVAADGTDIGVVSGISADVTAVSGVSADVTTVAGISTDVTSVAGVSANVTAVAGISANVTTVAGISANVTTAAAISADITTVAGISTNVSAVAAMAVGWNFDSATAMADPGSGDLRFNNATVASVTAIAVDDLDADGTDRSAQVVTWDDSTSTITGTLTVTDGTSGAWAVFSVTGLTDNAGWSELAVTFVASAGTFTNADALYVSFTRTGDVGAGATATQTVAGVVELGDITEGKAGTADRVLALPELSELIQDGSLTYIAAGGAADIQTLTLVPAITAYSGGQVFRFVPFANNATTTPTLNVNAVGAKTIQKSDGAGALGALVAGDLDANIDAVVSYNAAGDVFVLENPAVAAGGGGIGSFTGDNLLISSDSAAGDALTTGTNNIFLGDDAGGALTVGDNNIAIGQNAFNAAAAGASADNNIAIGPDAMGTGVVTGSDNTCIGRMAGNDLTTGTLNVMIGPFAGTNAATADDMIAIGNSAMSGTASTANENIGIGKLTGNALTDGNRNIFIGRSSGPLVNGGARNTYIGDNAGGSATTGANNMCLGATADVSTAAAADEATFGNTSIAVTRVQVDWTILSDKRDKANIKPLGASLDFINDLKPVSYQSDMRDQYFTEEEVLWRDADGNPQVHDVEVPYVDENGENQVRIESKETGLTVLERTPYTPDGSKMNKHRTTSFLAQDVLQSIEDFGEEGLGDLILATNPDKLELQRSGLIVPLVKALQEASAKIDDLEQRLTDAGL